MARAAGDVEQTLKRALDRDAAALRDLVDFLGPVVRQRVARALHRRGGAARQGAAQQLDDLVQETFVALFADDARPLRAFDPSRGVPLTEFVGMIAEHQVASILRSGRRNPWTEEPMAADTMERVTGAGGAPPIESIVATRQILDQLMVAIRAELTPRGLELFEMLYVESQAVEHVSAKTGMSMDAVYAWRSRLGKLVRQLANDLAGAVSNARPEARI
jgi:RNA polymerase sigma-70 factor (ECF subfamily)